MKAALKKENNKFILAVVLIATALISYSNNIQVGFKI